MEKVDVTFQGGGDGILQRADACAPTVDVREDRELSGQQLVRLLDGDVDLERVARRTNGRRGDAVLRKPLTDNGQGLVGGLDEFCDLDNNIEHS